ncbi:hypothetical protein HAALTHF_41580n [Vreelandella aquamarina]|nr:hypothetical protein HAALTHF_41580n [Halomonas axialensis]
MRIVPSQGHLLVADQQPALERVLKMGAWSPVAYFGADANSQWQLRLERADASRFQVLYLGEQGEEDGVVEWALTGEHNARNALAALAAARLCGVNLVRACAALARFKTPRRRQEVRGEVNGIQVIDDFAHHPTAIAATLQGLRAATTKGRLLAVIEPRSNTMRLGALRERLSDSVADADAVFWFQPAGVAWSMESLVETQGERAALFNDIDALVEAVVTQASPLDRIVVMSNGGFEGSARAVVRCINSAGAVEVTMFKPPVTVALTGASGAQYGLRLIDVLVEAGHEVWVMISKAAHMVIATETDVSLPAQPQRLVEALTEKSGAQPGQIRCFGREDWTAPVASGSGAPSAMVICPCSTGTLSAVATGASNNLIERAADVAIKERRTLVMVPRESPFSPIHLEHMLALSRLGVVILPAAPGFYHRPQSMEDLIDFIVARILNQLGIAHRLMPRWGEDAAATSRDAQNKDGSP